MTLFGPVHLALLAAIAACAVAVARTRLRPRMLQALGLGLACNEIGWYVYRYSTEGFRFPEGLPLQLCDLAVWLTVIAAVTSNRTAAEFLYFAGIAGAGLALLMPDLWEPWPSYPAVYFFLAHGGIVVITSALIFGGVVALRRGSMWRAFAVLNAYVAAVGLFNAVFGTNYVYLCRKPNSASLLDWFGPWPVYLIVAELFALALFAAMWLPFRTRRGAGAVGLNARLNVW